MKMHYLVTWLFGKLQIARMKGAERAAEYTAAHEVESLSDLTAAFVESQASIGLVKGAKVFFFIAHDSMRYVSTAIPHMRPQDLKRYSGRLAERVYGSPDMAWSARVYATDAGQDSLLIHVAPSSLLLDIDRICGLFGLRLMAAAPLAEVFGLRLNRIDVARDRGISLSVIRFPLRTLLITADSENHISFIRTLNYGLISDDADRLSTDIQRTLLYLSEREEVNASNVIVFGGMTDSFVARLSQELGVRTLDGGPPPDLSAWLDDFEQSARSRGLRALGGPKLVSAKRRVKIKRYASIAAVAIVASSAAIVSYIEVQVIRQHDELKELLQETHAAHDRLSEAHRELETIRRMNASVTAVTRPAPLSFALLASLPSAVDRSLTLQEISMLREAESWTIRLSGSSDDLGGDVVLVIDELQAWLKAPPWRIAMESDWQAAWMQSMENAAFRSDQSIRFAIAGSAVSWR
ncbi:MAG: hypothetical protein AAF515_09065 [Pseudomonadota bacterium]